MAFLVAYNQNIHLLGKNGLLPANKYMEKFVHNYEKSNNNVDLTSFKTKLDLYFKLPTLFWFFDWSNSIDFLLNSTAILGLGLSVLILVLGSANSILILVLWLLYHSIINIGQTWYSFGWESQVVESAFIVVFLVPFYSLKQVDPKSPPSYISLLIFRWLIARIMLGAVKRLIIS